MRNSNSFPRSRLRAPAALFAALALISSGVYANPYELFGFTPREQGLSGAQGVTGDDLGSIYYNPAGMIGHTKTEFGIGFSDSLMNLYINRAQANPTIASGYEDDAPRIEFGIIFPLGGAVMKDHVVLGLTFGTPVDSLIRVQTVDDSKPQFYMYQSKPQRFVGAGSLAIKIIDGLSLGFGVQLIADQIASVDFSIDLAARRFNSRDIDVELDTKATPIAGILVEPCDWMKIGFSWREESELFYTQPTTIDLGDIGQLVLNVAGYAQYWPNVFSLGTTIKPTRKLSVALQIDYSLWSRAPNDQVQVQIAPTGAVLDGLGLSSVLGFGSNDPPMNFSNILTPRVGLEYAATDWFTVRGGAYIRPPVTPDQTGTTNYLDNFTENISAGATFKFDDPLRVFTEPIHFDIAAALLVANDRSTVKSQAVDATGNYSYGGTIFSFGAMVRYLY